MSLLWSVRKMKFEAWPVEPPGFGSVPFSRSRMSRQPRLARCQAMLLPTMPAPMMTTRACVGTELISCLRPALVARRPHHPARSRTAAASRWIRSAHPNPRPDKEKGAAGIPPRPSREPLLGRDLRVDRVEVDALGAPIETGHDVEDRRDRVEGGEELDRLGVAHADAVQGIRQPLDKHETEEDRRDRPGDADERQPTDLVPNDRRLLVEVALPPRQDR